MNEKERRIKQQRTIDATRNNLMGLNGKLGIIAKYMGQAIISQESGGFASESFGYTQGTIYDFWGLEDDHKDEMPTMQDVEEEWINEPDSPEWTVKRRNREMTRINKTGWHFDGLGRGIHLEIKYVHFNDEEKSELTARHKGYLVYKEVGGDLRCYVPGEWEEQIDRLFHIAKKLDDEARKNEKEQRKEEAQKLKQGWLDKMKEYWGFNI